MNAVHWTIRALSRTFFWSYGHWRVIGHEKFPKTGPVIVAPNHLSNVDPPLIGSAIPRETSFMARHELWDIKGFPWVLGKLGVFPVKRGKPDRVAIRTALERLEKGLVVVMFPEGTRSPDGRLQRGEPGIALVIQKSGAPVIPCAVIGSNDMMGKGQKTIRPAHIKVIFGDPLFFTPDSPREEIVRAIMHAIAELRTAHGEPTVAVEDMEAAQSPVG